MVMFWIGFVIFVSLCVYAFVKEEGETIGQALLSGVFLCGTLYVIVIGLLYMGLCSIVVPMKYEYGWSNKIVAMQDGSAYVISRHTANESDRYYYMVQYDGYYKSYWSPQGSSSVIEVSNGNYEVKTYVQVPDAKNFFTKDLAKFYTFLYRESDRPHQWEFYVPKGSVVQDFKVDMKN